MNQENRKYGDIEELLKRFYSKELAVDVYPDFAAMAKVAISQDEIPNDSEKRRRLESTKVIFWRKLALGSTAAVALVGFITAGAHFFPKLEQTALAGLSHVPGIGRLVPQYDTGMLNVLQSNKVVYQNISSTQRNLKITLLTTYADTNRTVLFLRVTPIAELANGEGTWTEDLTGVELIDQFGHHYAARNADSLDGGVMIQFDPVPDWVRSAGMRFHLTIPSMIRSTTTNGRDLVLNGPWELSWTQVDEGAPLVLTPNVTSYDNGITVLLSKVLLSDSALLVECQIQGKNTNVVIDRAEFAHRYTRSNSKPPALDQFSMIEQQSGRKLNTLYGAFRISSTTSQTITGDGTLMFTPITTSGTYNLVITRITGVEGHWVLPFSIKLK